MDFFRFTNSQKIRAMLYLNKINIIRKIMTTNTINVIKENRIKNERQYHPNEQKD